MKRKLHMIKQKVWYMVYASKDVPMKIISEGGSLRKEKLMIIYDGQHLRKNYRGSYHQSSSTRWEEANFDYSPHIEELFLPHIKLEVHWRQW